MVIKPLYSLPSSKKKKSEDNRERGEFDRGKLEENWRGCLTKIKHIKLKLKTNWSITIRRDWSINQRGNEWNF